MLYYDRCIKVEWYEIMCLSVDSMETARLCLSLAKKMALNEKKTLVRKSTSPK